MCTPPPPICHPARISHAWTQALVAGNKPTDLETRVHDEVSGGFGSRTRRLKRFCGRSTGRNHTVASLGHVQYAGIEEGFGPPHALGTASPDARLSVRFGKGCDVHGRVGERKVRKCACALVRAVSEERESAGVTRQLLEYSP